MSLKKNILLQSDKEHNIDLFEGLENKEQNLKQWKQNIDLVIVGRKVQGQALHDIFTRQSDATEFMEAGDIYTG